MTLVSWCCVLTKVDILWKLLLNNHPYGDDAKKAMCSFTQWYIQHQLQNLDCRDEDSNPLITLTVCIYFGFLFSSCFFCNRKENKTINQFMNILSVNAGNIQHINTELWAPL